MGSIDGEWEFFFFFELWWIGEFDWMRGIEGGLVWMREGGSYGGDVWGWNVSNSRRTIYLM